MEGTILHSEVWMLGITLPKPFPLGFGTLSSLTRVFLILRVQSRQEVIRCIGEASIDFPFSHYDAWDVFYALSQLALEGESVDNRLEILERASSKSLLQFPAAYAALNMALDDAYGRIHHLSVPDLYGMVRQSGQALESIPHINDEAEFSQALSSVIARGRIPKLKGGLGVSEDLLRIAIADKSGSPYAIDFNATYTADEFAQIVTRLHGENIMFMEQPTTELEGVSGLSKVAEDLRQAGISVPVMADESFVTPDDAQQCTQHGVLLNYKIQKVGGIHVALQIEERLGEATLPSMVGGTFPTAIGRTWDQQALCVLPSASLPSDGWQPSTDWFDGEQHLVHERFSANSNGTSIATLGGGLGISVRWDRIEHYKVANPRSEYQAIRNNQSGDRLSIILKAGQKYSEVYERLSGRNSQWNL